MPDTKKTYTFEGDKKGNGILQYGDKELKFGDTLELTDNEYQKMSPKIILILITGDKKNESKS